MKRYILTVLLSTCSLNAGTLTDIGSKFVGAAVRGDFASVEETLWAEGGQKEAMLEAMKGAAGAIESGDLTITHIDRELIIGVLGATLIKIKTKSGEVDYDPIIYVKDATGWHILPYADEKGLKKFATSRTKDEQIHLRLFNEWANLVEEQEQQVEEDGIGQAPTRPESESEGGDKPQPEAEERSR